MEKKRLLQTGQSSYVDADVVPAPRHRNVSSSSSSAMNQTQRTSLFVIGAIAAALILLATLALMVSNWLLYIQSMSMLLQIMVWLIAIGLPVVVISCYIKQATRGIMWGWSEIENRLDQRADRKRRDTLALADANRVNAQADETRARAMQIARAIPMDQNGNAAVIGIPATQITQLTGQIIQPVPRSITTHNNAGLLEAGKEPSRARHASPSQGQLLDALVPNSLTVSPGIRNSNGEPVVVAITEIPHLKIIGSSGFGKSCLAAALLDQACQLNTPDKLQIALLDLEHKTSRLFEDRANVAEINLGTRRVTMVATNADEVAQHLGFLKRELSRRTKLSEHDLQREPVLLMYVEEMLSLQFEVEEELLQQMLADITVLAIRGRKYGMFLLAVSQTDYSTQDLRVAQKQFRFRAAAGIDITAARAAGFMNTELIKDNFQHGKPGQFVVEYPSFSDLVLAPNYDVKKLVHARTVGIQEMHTPPILQVVNSEGNRGEQGKNNSTEQVLQAKKEQIRALRVQNWGKINIIEKVWGVKRGGSQAYKDACVEYDLIISYLDAEN